MKHHFVIEVDAAGNLDRTDIQNWLENTLRAVKVFFQSGEVFTIKILKKEN